MFAINDVFDTDTPEYREQVDVSQLPALMKSLASKLGSKLCIRWPRSLYRTVDLSPTGIPAVTSALDIAAARITSKNLARAAEVRVLLRKILSNVVNNPTAAKYRQLSCEKVVSNHNV